VRYRSGGPFSGGILGFPPAISQLVLITVIVYLLQELGMVSGAMIRGGLGLVPTQVVTQGKIWELATYMFLHGGWMHLFFNMFGLVIFGISLEHHWGSREFVKYYFVTGIGAGVIQVIVTYLGGGSPNIVVIGASGAIFGILIAYGMAFPDRTVLLYFVIPIRARTFVAIYALLELFMTVQYHGQDGVARFAHLGGMLVGYLYLKRETLLWRIRRQLSRTMKGGGPRFPSHRSSDEEHRQRIDAILEKISREGFNSLTSEERRLLEESAERARRRQQGRGDHLQ
jgi:membrane associated rhomboid family serine protease